MVVNEFLSQHPDYRLVAAGEVLGKIGISAENSATCQCSRRTGRAVTDFSAAVPRANPPIDPNSKPGMTEADGVTDRHTSKEIDNLTC